MIRENDKNTTVDYTIAYEKFDKIMPDDNDLQWDYFNILDNKDLTSDEKRKELTELITDNIDMEKFMRYTNNEGTIDGLVNFILNNETIVENNLIGKPVLVNAGRFKNAKGIISGIPKNLGNVVKVTFDNDESVAIISKADFKLIKEAKSINYDKELQNILKDYDDNETSWKGADDRIRELTRSVRMAYNELMLDVVDGEEGYVESLNFREFKTPGQWNSNAKKQILSLWPKLNDYAKEEALKYFL